MIKDFTTYHQALKLKSLGFDEQCVAFFQKEYHEKQPIMVDDDDQYRLTGMRTCKNSEIPENYTAAPTFSQAFRWFREKYRYSHSITQHEIIEGQTDSLYIDESEEFQDIVWLARVDPDFIKTFKTYEEAEMACLDKLIEIIEK